MFLIVLAILIVIILVCVISILKSGPGRYGPGNIFEPEARRYGRRGEQYAANLINQVLREDDYLFTNVPVSYDGMRTELDSVVVNKCGVFIIEVKNYKGRLYGGEDDYEWQKYKDDRYGNTFEKNVKNPIKQVKRQIHILAKYLESHGVRVWVVGYALLLHGGSPVESGYILSSLDEIDTAIHTYARNRLSAQTVEKIGRLLSK